MSSERYSLKKRYNINEIVESGMEKISDILTANVYASLYFYEHTYVITWNFQISQIVSQMRK